MEVSPVIQPLRLNGLHGQTELHLLRLVAQRTAGVSGAVGHETVGEDHSEAQEEQPPISFDPYLFEPTGIGHTIYIIGHTTPPGKQLMLKLERIERNRIAEKDGDKIDEVILTEACTGKTNLFLKSFPESRRGKNLSKDRHFCEPERG